MHQFKHSFNRWSSSASWRGQEIKATIESMDTKDMETVEIGKRLEAFIKASGMNYVQFAASVAALEGADSTIGPQTVTHWRKTGKISRERVGLICQALGITPNDLLGSPKTRSSISGRALPCDRVDPGPDIVGRYPLLGTVPGGDATEAIEKARSDPSTEMIATSIRCTPSSYYLRVVGKSMEPDIQDGALILVDPGIAYGHGSIVVARNGNNEANVKRLMKDGGQWFLVPSNPEYHTKPLGDCVIVGVVRETVRRFV